MRKRLFSGCSPSVLCLCSALVDFGAAFRTAIDILSRRVSWRVSADSSQPMRDPRLCCAYAAMFGTPFLPRIYFFGEPKASLPRRRHVLAARNPVRTLNLGKRGDDLLGLLFRFGGLTATQYAQLMERPTREDAE